MTTQEFSLVLFDQILADVTVASKPIFEIKVTNAETEQQAHQAGAQITRLRKDVEKREKELLAPLKAQIDAIKTAADKVKRVLAQPEDHVRSQLNAYASELAHQREEALRIQREKEAAERRLAEEKRRREEAELRAKQEAERKRLEEEREAQRKAAAAEQEKRAAAAALFGGHVQDEEKKRREAEAKAEAERQALEAQQERERIAEQARIQREEDERARALEAQRREIEAQRVKGAKTEIIVTVTDAWSVPREFCRPPDVMIPDVKRAYKAGRKEIPGLRISEEAKVALRAETSSSLRAIPGAESA